MASISLEHKVTSAILLFSALSVLLAGRSPAGKLPVNERVIAIAQVWVDGIPLLPPYDVEVLGDTAVVVNSVQVKVIRAQIAMAHHTKTPFELTHDRAYAAMRNAMDAGYPDSVVADIGCAEFLKDTTVVFRAKAVLGGIEILGSSRNQILARPKYHDGGIWP